MNVKESEISESTLEVGHIAFFYRPRVDHKEAYSLEDVQRFYMVLIPFINNPIYRLIEIGKKQMLDPEHHRPFWAHTILCERSGSAIEDALKERNYTTKTRGMRTQPAARIVAKGVYHIIKQGKNTHLVYAIQTPHHLFDIQQEFNIKEKAVYVISIKNPNDDSKQPTSLPKYSKVKYPPELENLFTTKWHTADPIHLLDFSGVELLLIGEHDKYNHLPEKDIKGLEESRKYQLNSEKIFHELSLSRTKLGDLPLKGEWG